MRCSLPTYQTVHTCVVPGVYLDRTFEHAAGLLPRWPVCMCAVHSAVASLGPAASAAVEVGSERWGCVLHTQTTHTNTRARTHVHIHTHTRIHIQPGPEWSRHRGGSRTPARLERGACEAAPDHACRAWHRYHAAGSQFNSGVWCAIVVGTPDSRYLP